MFTQTLLAASACLMTANAHLFLSSPSPITGNAIKNPLEPDGSNFPCHGVALPGSGGQQMAVGSDQKLIFDAGTPTGQQRNVYVGGPNTAVHGGGSCQISITYETDPEKVKRSSAWKVLYSIEGGCPTNSLLNLDGTYQGPMGAYSNAILCSDPHANGLDCINDFEFKIPEGVKNGQATLAWTWFNNVGNPEMYMNCVAVDITGGSDNADMSAFPDMFLANLGTTYGGETVRTPVQNLKFPEPGKYVTTKTAFASTYMSAGVAQPIASASAYPLLLPGDAATTAGSYGAAPTSYAASSAASSPATAPTSYASAPSPYAAVPTLATAVSAAPVPSGTGSASSGNSTSGPCTNGKVSCPNPGAIICIDDKTFGLCNIDLCAVPQDVSRDTICSNGIISKRDVVRRRNSRIHRHIPNHIGHKHSF